MTLLLEAGADPAPSNDEGRGPLIEGAATTRPSPSSVRLALPIRRRSRERVVLGHGVARVAAAERDPAVGDVGDAPEDGLGCLGIAGLGMTADRVGLALVVGQDGRASAVR